MLLVGCQDLRQCVLNLIVLKVATIQISEAAQAYLCFLRAC